MTKKKPIIGVHNFCQIRSIPINLEIDFIEFITDYFNLFKRDKNLDRIIEYLLNNMTLEEILKYWIIFINTKKDILPIV